MNQYDPTNDDHLLKAVKRCIEYEDWQKFFLSFPGIYPSDLLDDMVPITKRALRVLVNRINELEKENKTLIDFIAAKNLAEYMENQLIEGEE